MSAVVDLHLDSVTLTGTDQFLGDVELTRNYHEGNCTYTLRLWGKAHTGVHVERLDKPGSWRPKTREVQRELTFCAVELSCLLQAVAQLGGVE